MKNSRKILSAVFLLFAINAGAQWNFNGNHIYNINSGNVGIGTSNPLKKLHVEGEAGIQHSNAPRLLMRRTAGSPIMWNLEVGAYVQGNGFAFTDLTNSIQKLILESGSTGNIYFPSGNVGIGTSNPLKKLHVEGEVGIQHSNAPRLLMRRTAGSPIMWNLEVGACVQGNGFAFADLTNSIQKLILESGSTGNIYFPSGGVGIGTTSMPSGYKLAIDGKVIAGEIEIQLSTSWPDFVFEKNYELRSLSELEEFINTNGHLPDVPTAEEIKDGTLKLGEMNAAFMQKIEELTLYVFELKKEIEDLKRKIPDN